MTKITIERETLLPCPFCGCGAAITGTEWDGREQYFVACTGPDCHCAVGENYDRDACPEYSFSSKDDAIAAWNRRAALAAQQEPNMRHPKIQALIGKNARQHIWMMLVEQLVEDPHFETTAMDMEYWDTLHDKLKEKLTAAPPAPAAVPLTDAALVNAYCKTTGVHQFVQAFVAGARYAEGAHGIAAAGDKP